MSRMFAECDLVTSFTSNAQTADVFTSGLWREGCVSASGISVDYRTFATANVTDASYFLTGCDVLSSVVSGGTSAAGLFSRASVNATYAFSENPVLSSVNVSYMATGSSAKLSHMFENSATDADATTSSSWTLSNVGTGASADLSYLCAGATGLNRVSWTSVGSGTNANLTYAASGLSSCVSGVFSSVGSASGANFSYFASNSFGTNALRPVTTATATFTNSAYTTANMSYMFENTFTDSTVTSGTITYAASSFSRPSTMTYMLTGTGATAIDLRGITYYAIDMSYMGSYMQRITSVTYGSGAGASSTLSSGTLMFYSAANTSTTTNRTGQFTGCPKLTTVSIVGGSGTSAITGTSGVAVRLESMFEECGNLQRVTFNGSNTTTPPGYVNNMRSMYKNCHNLYFVDMRGISVASMSGTQLSLGELAYMGDMFYGCDRIVTETGGPSSTLSYTTSSTESHNLAASSMIRLGTGWTKILCGFFWMREDGTSAPTYVMSSTSVVDVYTGPATFDNLMACPNVTVSGKKYQFQGKIYLMDTNAALRLKAVWVKQGYASNIAFDETTVEGIVGKTGHAFGKNILGWGFIGNNGTNSREGSSVVWVIRQNPSTKVGTMCIFPNTGSGYSSGTMQNFTSDSLSYGAWTKMAGSGGDGYSKSFSQCRVYRGVYAGSSLESMFEGCSNLRNVDMSSMTVQSTCTNFTRMFAGCTNLAGVSVNVYSEQQTTAASNTTSAADYSSAVAIGSGLRFRATTSNSTYYWNTNTSNMDFRYMFSGCTNMVDGVDMRSCLTGSYLNATYMFGAAPSTTGDRVSYSTTTISTKIYLSSMGTGSYADMRFMFYNNQNNTNSSKVATITLSSVGTGSYANMTYMLSGVCNNSSLVNTSTSLSMSSVGTAAGSGTSSGTYTNMTYMFSNNRYLRSITLSSVGTSTYARLSYMFQNCYAITTVNCTYVGSGSNSYMDGFLSDAGDTSTTYINSARTASYSFNYVCSGGCYTFSSFMSGACRSPNITSASVTWTNSNSTRTSSSNGSGGSAFSSCSRVTKFDVRGMPIIGTYVWGGCSSMFSGCSSIKYVQQGTSAPAEGYIMLPSTWNLSGSYYANSMFSSCTSLLSATISSVSTYGSTTTSYYTSECLASWFSGCTSLTSVNISFSGYGSCYRTFYGCTALTTVNITGRFYTVSTRQMFSNCSKLTTCNLTSLDTSKVGGTSASYGTSSHMSEMFRGSSAVVMNSTGSSSSPVTCTITLGSYFAKVLNGFFAYQSSPEVAPTYIMATNTRVNVTNGVTSVDNLMFCPNYKINGVTYKYAGGANMISYSGSYKSIWQQRGYFGSTVSNPTSGYIGYGTNSSPTNNSNTVYWEISGGTLTITAKSTNGMMRNFGNSASDAAPWSPFATGKVPTFTKVVFSNTVYSYTSLQYMFYGCESLQFADLSNLRTNRCTNMNYMFQKCYNLNGPVSSSATSGVKLPTTFSTSNLTSAQYAFDQCKGLTSVTLSNVFTASTTNLAYMFQSCTGIKSVSLSSVGTGSTNHYYGMFSSCTGLESATVRNIANGSTVNRTDSMFSSCTNLKTVILESSINGKLTSTAADSMFSSCQNLRSVSLNNVGNYSYPTPTKNNYDQYGLRYMFQSCFTSGALAAADVVPTVTLTNVGNGSYMNLNNMFTSCTYLKKVTMTNVGTGSYTALRYMFNSCQSLTNVTANTVGTGAYAELYRMFDSCATNNTGIPANTTLNWSFTNVGNNYANLNSMFRNSFSSVNIAPDSKFEWKANGTSYGYATSMGAMFAFNSYFNSSSNANSSINTSNWDHMVPWDYRGGSYSSGYQNGTATLKNRLQHIDLTGLPQLASSNNSWNSNLNDISMTHAFEDLDGITSVGYSTSDSLILRQGWLTTSVIDMTYMFRGCANLKTVELRDFCIRSTMNPEYMFYDCPNLEKVEFKKVSSSVGSASSMNSMFYNCPKLYHVDLSGFGNASISGSWDANGVTECGMQNLFRGCTRLMNQPATDSGEPRSKIIVGTQMTKLLNGFFWYRTSVYSNPVYVIQADVDVYGGPTSASYLLTRPSMQGYNYSGLIDLKDSAAIGRVAMWLQRDYVNYATNGVKRLDWEYGELGDYGFIGYVGSCTTINGASITSANTAVMWSMRENTSTGITTLVIFPTDNTYGMMRVFSSTNESQLPPWNRYSQYRDKFQRMVVCGQVEAYGSLAGFMDGCIAVDRIDLTHLEVTTRTSDVNRMFRDDTKLTYITNTVTEPEKTDDGLHLKDPGVYLPKALDPTNAMYMMSGCTALENVKLENFGTRTNADNFTYMFQNSFAPGGRLTMTNCGLGNSSTFQYMCSGAEGLAHMELDNVATGTNALMQYAFKDCTGLAYADLNRVGCGTGANLSYMFQNAASKVSDTATEDATPAANDDSDNSSTEEGADDSGGLDSDNVSADEDSDSSTEEGDPDSGAVDEEEEETPGITVRYNLMDVGTGGNATMTSMFIDAFADPMIASDSQLRYHNSGSATAAYSMQGMFDSGSSTRSYMPTYDLRGLPGNILLGSANRSLDRMFYGLSEVEVVRHAQEQEMDNAPADLEPITDEDFNDLRIDRVVVLPQNWDTAGANTRQYMFADMPSLVEVDLINACQNTYVNMAHMFAEDRNLEKVAFSTTDSGRMSSATSFVGLFLNCERLWSVDMQGVGTSMISTTDRLDITNAPTNMNGMFEGASVLVSEFGETPEIPEGLVPEGESPHITIGSGWTKVVNGFFWNKPNVDDEAGGIYYTPTYVLACDVNVYGGPTTVDNLMYCPGAPYFEDNEIKYDGPYRYTHTIYIMDDQAFIYMGVWADRKYLRVTNSSGLSEEVIIGGTLGYGSTDHPLTWNGQRWDGTSVSWRIIAPEEDEPEGTGTLRIYPTIPGTMGLMRDMGSDDLTYAPWVSEKGDLWKMFDKVVVEGEVRAHGSLENMFLGCANAKFIDLTNLIVTDETASTYQMFANCTGIDRVLLADKPVPEPDPEPEPENPSPEAGGGSDSPEANLARAVTAEETGILILPRDMDTSGVTNAGGMFTGCSSLKSIDFTGFADAEGNPLGFMNADKLDATEMFSNAFVPGSTILLNDSFNGTSTSVEAMFQNSLLTNVYITNSVQGDGANLQYTFQSMPNVSTLHLSNVGTGYKADFTRTFSDMSNGVANDTPIKIDLVDVACGGAILTNAFTGTGVNEGLHHDSHISWTTSGPDVKVQPAIDLTQIFAATSIDAAANEAAEGVRGYMPTIFVPALPSVSAANAKDESVKQTLRATFYGQLGVTSVGPWDGTSTLPESGTRAAAATAPRGEAVAPLDALGDMSFVARGVAGSTDGSDSDLDDIRSVVNALTLPAEWDVSKSDDMTYIFGKMDNIESAYLVDFGAGRADMQHMFDECPKLTTVTFAKSSDDATVGSAKSMNYMFNKCKSLFTLDFTGLGTSAITGSVDVDGVAYTEMRHMFEECTAMSNAGFIASAGAVRPHITIGPSFTKIYNGFFWDRESVNVNPTYTIAADVDVYGGPSSEDDLMVCPLMEGNTYSGTINLADEAAVNRRMSWIIREYVGLEIDGVPIDPSEGELVASGYIGYKGAYTYAGPDESRQGQTISDQGTSVAWSIRTLDGVGTLSIFPTDCEWGLMRDIGKNDRTTMAPWVEEAGYGLAHTFSRVVVADTVTAHGALEYFTSGTDATYVDLRNLEIKDDVISLYGAFQNMEGIQTITSGWPYKTTEGGGGEDLPNTLVLPANADTSGILRATYAFADMPNLRDVTLGASTPVAGTPDAGEDGSEPVLTGWNFPGSNVDLTYLFANSFTNLGFANDTANPPLLKLKEIGNGAGANMQYMFDGAWGLRTVELTDVGTGIQANMRNMFTGAKGLRTLQMRRVGSGTNSYLNNMFTDASSGDNSLFPANATDGRNKIAFDLYEVGYTVVRDSDGNPVRDADGNFQVTGSGARLEHMFEGAFTTPNLDSASHVTFHMPGDGEIGSTLTPEDQAAILEKASIASASYLFFGGVDATQPDGMASSYIANVDLRGLPKISTMAGAEATLAYMFAGCDRIETVGHTGDEDVILPATYERAGGSVATWRTLDITDMSYMFAGCQSLTTVKMVDFVTNAHGTKLAYMFADCPALKRCELTSSDKDSPYIGEANNMRYMFANCKTMDYVSLFGVGTSRIDGSYGTDLDPTYEGYFTEDSGMAYMFDGCTVLNDNTKNYVDVDNGDIINGVSNELGTTRPIIEIGPYFSKVLNGFVWQRNSVEDDPVYVIAAQLEVYGGPVSTVYLMQRPSLLGAEYNGYVDLVDQSAVDHLDIWSARDYINIKVQGKIWSQPEDGDLIAWGYIGYDGLYEGTDYNGTSVAWSIRRNPNNNMATLLIYPTVGITGVMRGFGTTDATLAPWNSLGGGYAEIIDTIKVREDTTVYCNGSLEAMFYGCKNVKYADLRNLKFVSKNTALQHEGVSSTREMFRGMSQIETVGFQAGGTEDEPTGIVLPGVMDTASLTDASFMFADMPKLKHLQLQNFGSADCVTMNYMVQGSFRERSTGSTANNVTLTNVGTGLGANLSYMFYDATFLEEASLTNVGTGNPYGEGAAKIPDDLTYMFAKCPSLVTVNANTVGSGGEAKLSYMFYGVVPDDNTYISDGVTATFNLINVGVGGDAQMDSMFADAFHANVSEDSKVSFTVNDGSNTLPSSRAATMRSMFSSYESGEDVYSTMPKFDLSGLPSMHNTTNITPSLAYMFFGCSRIETVGYGATDSVILPTGWGLREITSMAGMFANCPGLKSVDFIDPCTSGITGYTSGVNMAGMFALCPLLKSVNLTSSGTITGKDGKTIGQATDMRWMFQGDESLVNIDFSGVGTADMQFQMEPTLVMRTDTNGNPVYDAEGNIIYDEVYAQETDRYGVLQGAMSRMFEGCTIMDAQYVPKYDEDANVEYYVPKGADVVEANAVRNDDGFLCGVEVPFSTITIGTEFKRVLNGFFQHRDIADEPPIYVINSDVYVYGGPQRAQDLMWCPSIGGYEYIGQINLSDSAAKERKDDVWRAREYLSMGAGAVTVEFYANWTKNGETLTTSPTLQTKSFRGAVYYRNNEGETDYTRPPRVPGAPITPTNLTVPVAYGYTATTSNGSDTVQNGAGGTYTYGNGDVLWYTDPECTQLYGFGDTTLEPTAEGDPVKLYSTYKPIEYTVTLANMGTSARTGVVATLGFEDGAFTLPDPRTVTSQGPNGTTTVSDPFRDKYGVSFQREGYDFAGWTVGTATPSSTTSTDYIMPGESVGATGTRGVALSGAANTPAVLYAHWVKVPIVRFYINGSLNYILSGETSLTVNAGLRLAYAHRQTEADATDDPSAWVEGQTLGRIIHFDVDIPQVEKNSNQPDTSWRMNYDCTLAWPMYDPSVGQMTGMLTTDGNGNENETGIKGVVDGDTILYRRLFPAKATVWFEPGFENSAPEHYSTSYDWVGDFQIPANQFRRPGYEFKGWEAIDCKNPDVIVGIFDDRGSVDYELMRDRIISDMTFTGTFRATWELATYSITYVMPSNAGFPNNVSVALQYQTPSIPAKGIAVPNPQRPGYHFDGWTGSNGDVPQVDYSIPPGTYGNLTFTANWSTENYSITYDIGGGRWPGDAAAPSGYNTESAPIVIPTPVRDGYRFDGWTGGHLGSNMQANVTVPSGITGNLHFVAHWTAIEYNIRYTIVDGETDNTQYWPENSYVKSTYFVTDSDYTIPTPVRPGYTFAGWYERNTPNVVQMTVTVATGTTGDLHYTARWSSDGYTITYNMGVGSWEGVEEPPSRYTATSSPIVVPQLADVSNSMGKWIFAGWSGTGLDKLTKTFTIPRGSVGNREYTANFVPERVLVNFEANFPDGISVEAGNATIADGALNPFTVEGSAYQNTRVPLPTEDGITATRYILRGWATTPDALENGTDYFAIGKPPTMPEILAGGGSISAEGSVTLYAQWETAARSIHYHLYGSGTVPDAAPQIHYARETTSLASANPTWQGEGYKYAFAGWYTSPSYEDGTLVTEIAATVETEVNLYARWDYQVTYSGNLPDFATVTGLPDSARVTFIPTDEMLEREGVDTDGASAADFFAAWKAYAPTRTPLVDLTAAGYTFKNEYNTRYDGSGESFAPGAQLNAGASSPDVNNVLALYVQWEANTYQVAFDASSVVYYDTDGNRIVLPDSTDESDPQATGVVDGSSYETSVSAVYGSSWNVPGSVPHRYITGANAGDGEGDDEDVERVESGWKFDHWEGTNEAGDTVTFPAGATTSERLLGWLGSGSGDGSDATGVSTLTAIWRFSAYAGYLEGAGGTARTGYTGNYTLFPADGSTTVVLPAGYGDGTGVVASGAAAVPADALPYVREGFRFTGWEYKDSTGATKTIAADASVAARTVDLAEARTITFNAKWDAIPYVVQFIGNTEDEPDKVVSFQDTNYMGAAPVYVPTQPNDLKNHGLTLSGWGPARDGNGLRYTMGSQVFLTQIIADMRAAGYSDADIWTEKDGTRTIKLYGHWSAVMNFTVPTQVLFMIDPDTKDAMPVNAEMTSSTAGVLDVVAVEATSQKDGFDQFFANVIQSMMDGTVITVRDDSVTQDIKDAGQDTVRVPFNTVSPVAPVGGTFRMQPGSLQTPYVMPLTYGLELDTWLREQRINKIYDHIQIGQVVYTVSLNTALS